MHDHSEGLIRWALSLENWQYSVIFIMVTAILILWPYAAVERIAKRDKMTLRGPAREGLTEWLRGLFDHHH